MTRNVEAVLTANIDTVSWDQALGSINDWAEKNESRYICICNVHSVVTASQDADFRNVINAADMATPDGAPVAWFLRKLGHKDQQRINGPDLMWKHCSEAEKKGISIYLYGGMPEVLELLKLKLKESFPDLKIAGDYSPPFRALTEVEEKAIIDDINNSGAGVVWVSLGCPKQEVWMSNHRGKINAVMVGVGAAFDYHAGTIIRAPLWMQNSGLEWLHRLSSEPKRLWKRYLLTNSLFIYKVILAFLMKKK